MYNSNKYKCRVIRAFTVHIVVKGQVTKHDKFPVVSTKKADFQSTEDIGGESGRHDMVKAHGTCHTQPCSDYRSCDYIDR